MIVVGLTGSIGMGKTTTAAMFADAGAAVFDADAAVHKLYAPGGAATRLVAQAFPDVVTHGAVDRAALGALVRDDPVTLKRLEALVHPLVADARAAFLKAAAQEGRRVAVLDVPLLFETGGDRSVDVVVVASAPEAVQRARVLARAGMTPAMFEAIRARQTPDADKRARADYIVETGEGLEAARTHVARIMADLSARAGAAPRD